MAVFLTMGSSFHLSVVLDSVGYSFLTFTCHVHSNDKDVLQVIELVAMASLSESCSIYSRGPNMLESSEMPIRIISTRVV